MSKRIIVNNVGLLDTKSLCEEGEEFPVYEGADANLKWIDVPDDIDLATMNNPRLVNGTITDTRPETETVKYLTLERQHAYGSWQDQLDMQYHDLVDGTTTWKDAVQAVKDANPKP